MGIIAIYIVLVVALTIWAENWKNRGELVLLCSVLLSPFIGFLVLMASEKKILYTTYVCGECGKSFKLPEDMKSVCPHCGNKGGGSFNEN